MAVQPLLIEMGPSEVWTRKFDFSDFGVMREGDTLASATATCPVSGLTLGTAMATEDIYVEFVIGPAIDVAAVYKVTILALTTGGATLEAWLNVRVKKPTGF